MEYAHLSRAGMRVFAIEVSEVAARSAGLLRTNQHQQLDKSSVESLLTYCSRVRADASSNKLLSRNVVRRGVLARLQLVIEPWLKDAPETFEYTVSKIGGSLVKRAESILHQTLESQNPISVGQLSKAVGVSERTLFRNFEAWVGMGPSEYFRLMKLHRFRQQLLDSPHERGAISKAAQLSGFDHLSRLSGLYTAHFGELPSETLRRRSG